MGTSGTIKCASTRRTTSSRDVASTDDKATYAEINITETFHDVKRPYEVSKFNAICAMNTIGKRPMFNSIC